MMSKKNILKNNYQTSYFAFLLLVFVLIFHFAGCGGGESGGDGSYHLFPNRTYTENYEDGLDSWDTYVEVIPNPDFISSTDEEIEGKYIIDVTDEQSYGTKGKKSIEFQLFGDKFYYNAWITRRIFAARQQYMNLSLQLWSSEDSIYPRSNVIAYIGKSEIPTEYSTYYLGPTDLLNGWRSYSTDNILLDQGEYYTVALGLGTRWGTLSHYYIDEVKFTCQETFEVELVGTIFSLGSGSAIFAGQTLTDGFEEEFNSWTKKMESSSSTVEWSIKQNQRQPKFPHQGVWTVEWQLEGEANDTIWIIKKFHASSAISNITLGFQLWSDVLSLSTKGANVLAYIGHSPVLAVSYFHNLGTTEKESGWYHYSRDFSITLDDTEEFFVAIGLQLRNDAQFKYFIDELTLRAQ